jgi:hypothetical protein
MDPHAVLGVKPSAGPDEVAAAYRDLAKRFHPDTRPEDATAAERMADINTAYAMLRDGLAAEAKPKPETHGRGGTVTSRPATAPRAGDAVKDARVRKALGPELLSALAPDEPVHVITDAATWESPRVRLAVTDRRLLWLLADAPLERVRSLPWRRIKEADVRPPGRLRRRAELRVQPITGKRLSFAEMDHEAAGLVHGRIRAAT